MSGEKRFYVYTLSDSRTGEVFYVGKGTGKRASHHTRNYALERGKNKHKINKINKIRRNGGTVIASRVKDNITEDRAFELEKFLIEEIGFDDLTNMTKGGRGGSLSEEMKENLRQHNLGKELSEETKQKLSEALSGREVSEETRRRMSEAEPLRGEEVGGAILTKQEASEVLWLTEETMYRYIDIGILYGASKGVVQDIANRLSWTHVNPRRPPQEVLDILKGSPKAGGVRAPNLDKEVVGGIKWMLRNSNLRKEELAKVYGVAEITVSQMDSGTYHEDVPLAEPKGYNPWGRVYYSVIVYWGDQDTKRDMTQFPTIPSISFQIKERQTMPMYVLLKNRRNFRDK